MAQKPVLRGEVGCACVAREVSVERGGTWRRAWSLGLIYSGVLATPPPPSPLSLRSSQLAEMWAQLVAQWIFARALGRRFRGCPAQSAFMFIGQHTALMFVTWLFLVTSLLSLALQHSPVCVCTRKRREVGARYSPAGSPKPCSGVNERNSARCGVGCEDP